MEQNVTGPSFNINDKGSALFQRKDSKVKFGWSENKSPGFLGTQEQGRPPWNEFTESTTFHGIKYIFDFNASRFRRALWVCCVLLSVGLFLVQVSVRAGAYFSYKSNVHVAVVYEKELPFPAVTICNQNNFRLTKTLERGKLVYEFIDEIYSEAEIIDVKEFDITGYNDTLSKIDLKEFITTTAHQKSDLIDSCRWKGQACNLSDFKTVYTDLGVCNSFNFYQNETQYTNIAGNRGLSLVMNVEQYEYMRGPQNDAGLKIFLHHQDDTPMVKDMGFSVAPGTHTEIGINYIKKLSLQSPYGDCHPYAEPLTKCMTKCKAITAQRMCGCKDLYMETESPTCNMEKAFRCIPYATEIGEGDIGSCQCSSPCEQSLYEHSFSFATLSKFNIERVVLNEPKEHLKVKKKIMYAKEMSVRNIDEVWEKDKKQVEDLLNVTSLITENIAALSHEWTVIFDIIFMMEDMIEKDKANDFFQERKILIDCIMQGRIPKSNGDCYGERNTSLFITHIISYISKLQSHLFNPSSHSLLDYLEDCFNRYGNLELNISSSSSPYACPSYSNSNTSSNYSVTKIGTISTTSTTTTMSQEQNMSVCRKIVQCKADSALALCNEKPDHLDGILDLIRSHINFTEYMMLLNTTRSGDDFSIKSEKYATCLNQVNNLQNVTSMYSLVTLSEMVKQFHSLRYGQLEEVLNHTRNMTTFFDYQQLNDALLSVMNTCIPWVTTSFCTNRMLEPKCNLRYIGDVLLMIYPQYEDVKNMIKKLHDHWTKIVPVMKDLSKYLDGTLTKSELVGLFFTPGLANKLSIKSDVVMNLIDVMTTFMETLPGIKSELIESYSILYLESNLNERLMSALYTLFEIKDDEDDYQAGFEHLLNNFFHIKQDGLQDYIDFLEEEAETAFNTNMDTFMENLFEYSDEIRMDEEFFMANFLQVDIFYKELKYEKIEQQVAFSLISLFSEIGGFLGLLLGASVLTVCELLDYIALLIISRMHKLKSTKVTSLENESQPPKDSMA